ncbi:hypothetical protein FACS189455_3520 [Bacteroidia bacterium]|nr:hypothetical protein FACS189455_3520 [Bacteroidia bacterium]
MQGTIVDKTSQTPLEYVTVEIINQDNPKYVSGTITDSLGYFALDGIPDGKYKLQCNLLGYGKNTETTFIIGQNNRNINTGIIEIVESTLTLDEVVVTGQKSTYVTRIDKKIFNVAGDLMSSSGSASDLMQNIPSVQVDIDGNVSLRGSENVQILINGKSSVMMGATLATTNNYIRYRADDEYQKDLELSAVYEHTFGEGHILSNMRYTSKVLTPQGYREPSFIMNVGARYSLLHNKAHILFTTSDLLNTYRSVTTIDTPYLKERVERKRASQIFYIGFTYNFGKSARKNKEATLKYDEQL